MARYLHLEIPDPCNANWENMTEVDAGRFCMSCQKTVIDFSTMPEEQIIAFFKKKPKHVCGRFHEDQLAQTLEIPTKRIPWLKYFFQVTIPVFLFGEKVQAQGLMKKNRSETTVVATKHVKPQALKLRIHGTVIDTKGQPVPYASLLVKGSTMGCAADSNGNYTLSLSGFFDTLQVSATGYKIKELDLRSLNTNSNEQIILESNTDLKEVVVTGYGPRHFKGSVGGAISVKVKKIRNSNPVFQPVSVQPTAEIFPNPAPKNGMVTIRFAETIEHPLTLTIFHSNGTLVQQKNISITKGVKQFSLPLTIVTAGNYFIEIVDQQTKKKQVMKLLVL